MTDEAIGVNELAQEVCMARKPKKQQQFKGRFASMRPYKENPEAVLETQKERQSEIKTETEGE